MRKLPTVLQHSRSYAYYGNSCNFRLLNQPVSHPAVKCIGKKIRVGMNERALRIYRCAYTFAASLLFGRYANQPAQLDREKWASKFELNTTRGHEPVHTYADLRRFKDPPCYRRPTRPDRTSAKAIGFSLLSPFPRISVIDIN